MYNSVDASEWRARSLFKCDSPLERDVFLGCIPKFSRFLQSCYNSLHTFGCNEFGTILNYIFKSQVVSKFQKVTLKLKKKSGG